MNGRRFFQTTLYILAFVLTLALVLPAISSAQGNDWVPDGNNIYFEGGNVGIGGKPATQTDVRLAVTGHTIIKSPTGWASTNDVARLYFGDFSHWIQSKYGYGIFIKPSQARWDAFLVQEKTGFVGIGTAFPKGLLSVSDVGRTQNKPRALIEVLGSSGTTGLNLRLEEAQASYTGGNSPMIKWDSTAYSGSAGTVSNIWFARAERDNWVLRTSRPNYTNVKTVIKITKDGEVCLGRCD